MVYESLGYCYNKISESRHFIKKKVTLRYFLIYQETKFQVRWPHLFSFCKGPSQPSRYTRLRHGRSLGGGGGEEEVTWPGRKPEGFKVR